jgi:LacI family transcriptional regulator
MPVVLGLNTADTPLDEEFGYNIIRDHLAKSNLQYDGIFAVHDGLAYGVIRALLEAGCEVPKKVSVVGFDDQDPSAYFQPPLTTVRQPMQEIGREAARLLLRRLEQKDGAPAARQRIALEPAVIIRGSTMR